MTILSNQVRCRKCGDEPYSASRHDFQMCKCGAVGVDGGQDYLRRIGNPSEYEDLSIEIPHATVEAMMDALEWARNTGRNDFGAICAVARAHRDSKFPYMCLELSDDLS